jgi:glycosyltransferase involved in cell wall biosynthesis
MQAMACGLAVVTTPVGSIEEIVSDGRTGVLVPPQDVAALRSALESLLGDDERRRSLGAQAALEARERFAESRMVDGMIEVFSEASANHG